MKGALLFLLPFAAKAACPNSCSGHGTCGQYDSCTCYDNWVGPDCSKRQCMSGTSWVTTSRGDINFDGDVFDATVHNTDAFFDKTSVEFVRDQHSPGGTWESWPSIFNKAGKDEGHFYMECSNRGLCNRDSGECECFGGYTGEACRRTVCPNDCSGHGTCQTVNQQVGALTYTLWDGDMSRSCVCDPGFGGPACGEKLCPRGDDPLTTDQIVETQWVEIFSDNDADLNTDGPMKGTFTLMYTDYYGETWSTADISIDSAAGSLTVLASAAEAALEGIPNMILADVTVTAEYCGSVIPMLITLGDTAAMTETTATTAVTVASDFTEVDDTHIVSCPSDATNGAPMAQFTGDVWKATADMDGADVAPGTVTDGTCFELSHANCVRLKITFDSTPGSLNDLVVDTSGVTIENEDTNVDETEVQGATSISSTVTDENVLISAGFASTAFGWTYEIEEDIALAGTADIGVSDAANLNRITVSDAADSVKWQPDERVKIKCGSKVIGTYTISGDDESTGTIIYLQENAPICAGDAAADPSTEITFRRMTPYIQLNADLTGSMAPGDRLAFDASHGYAHSAPIRSISWNKWVSTVDTGRILFEEGTGLSTSLTGSLTGALSAQTTLLSFAGKGTSESSTCSDRGVCDTEAGDCKCFGGYTGLACEHQNALSA